MGQKTAFLLGTDASQKEYAQWVIRQLNQNESCVDIAVFDFDRCMAMSMDLTILTSTRPTHGVKGWYLKPYAILEALQHYDKVVWLDNDLELRGDIDDLAWNLVPQGKIGMAVDLYASKKANSAIYNSGVVVADKHCVADLEMWWKHCQSMKFRGDQETYSALVTRGVIQTPFVLPKEYNWLRLDPPPGPDDYPKVFHWTGPIGKIHISNHLLYK